CLTSRLTRYLLEVSDHANAEAHPGIDPSDLRIPGEVAESIDRDLVRRRIRHTPVVVAPVPHEVVARRLRRERVGVLDDVTPHVVRTPGGRSLRLADRAHVPHEVLLEVEPGWAIDG